MKLRVNLLLLLVFSMSKNINASEIFKKMRWLVPGEQGIFAEKLENGELRCCTAEKIDIPGYGSFRCTKVRQSSTERKTPLIFFGRDNGRAIFMKPEATIFEFAHERPVVFCVCPEYITPLRLEEALDFLMACLGAEKAYLTTGCGDKNDEGVMYTPGNMGHFPPGFMGSFPPQTLGSFNV